MQSLKSKYEQQEMKVSEGFWDRLEEKLDQSPAKKEKPKMIWLRYAAAVIFLCGLGGILWMTNNKAEVNGDQQFASQSENEKSIPASVKKSENAEAVKSNPINPILDSDNQKFAVKNEDSSTRFTLNEVETPRMKNSIRNEKLASNQIPEKELIIKKEEPQIVSKPEEQSAHTDIQKPREKVKYVSSSDLLFGVEIDKAKTETPKSAIGINTLKKNDSDFPNPKRIKLFGITLYEKDSITTK